MAHRVVIVGAGFGGLYAARALRNVPVSVTLIDRRNFHLFQPLLYQVATGGLSPANIAAPIRGILKRNKNTGVVLGEVSRIDVPARKVFIGDSAIEYDTLIVATGSRHHYFGNEHWEAIAPGLKTLEDATEIRRRILTAFESAERELDAKKRAPWLTFVVVGGGPTGVELAGAIAEIANDTLRHEFRKIDPSEAKIVLLEGADRILLTFPPELSAKAHEALEEKRVQVRTNVMVTDVSPEAVTFKTKEGPESILTRTILWAAGVKASPLGKMIADATGAEIDKAGRVTVQPDLSMAEHPEIFVIGDLANFSHQRGKPLPGVAPVAMQEGAYVARAITTRLEGKSPPPFKYHDKGNLATIGRSAAVADLGWIRFDGFAAWLAWLFIHIMYLARFENRLLVLLQWGWNYITMNRSARLITETAESSEKKL